MKRHYAWLFALALMGMSSTAQAQGYIGIGAGNSKLDIKDDVQAGFAAAGTTCGVDFDCAFDDSDTGFKIFGGSRINPNFAAEGFYADLGEASVTITGAATGVVTAEADAFGAAALGIAPLGANFELLGKVGLVRWSLDVTGSVSGLGTIISLSDDGFDPFFGLGAQWNGNGLSVRGEFERFDLDGTDVDLASISVIFNL